MPSLQNAAPGAKSSKMQGLNPFTPFLAQPDELEDGNGAGVPEERLSESLDRRLRVTNSNAAKAPDMAYQPQYVANNQQPTGKSTSVEQQSHSAPTDSGNQTLQEKDEKKTENESIDEDSDLDEYEDDDQALEAFRQRRLAELQQAHSQQQLQVGKGHGEVRTITQDEFLPECTSSHFVVVHFFHKDFERCKLMDNHLKVVAPLHLSCKFIRIDAEKAPFFVAKLAIKTLPTLLVFQDGKTVDRLLGFEGLSDTKHPDEFPTSRLGRWLEKTGAIEYDGPESDDEDEEVAAGDNGIRGSMLSSRYQVYDDDV